MSAGGLGARRAGGPSYGACSGRSPWRPSCSRRRPRASLGRSRQRRNGQGHGLGDRPDGLGIQPGKIKHVWLIILENKSYDATFTGLNNNTYLWQTLPSQGVLLKNYYGTGHFSLDNYISMVSGQATQPDTQADCPYYDAFPGSIDMTGNLETNPNYGQMVSAAGPNAAAGQNGCVYPASVPTLFNQLDAAGVSWKGYAQDLGNPDASSTGTLASPGTGQTHDAGIAVCGAPYASPGTTGSTANPNPGSANATDQYVPKHFPFPWFESILQSGDCNSTHIASLFDPTNGLYHDLQSEATTPAFSWISPNNCSDAHDAVCHGNNLSGGFADPNTPNPPVNYTGGLYAADLFLEHVVPEIEASPAFKDGGLIDITFDEAFPPFTFTRQQLRELDDRPADRGDLDRVSDSAGETLFGQTVHTEPTGPNTPLATDANGDQLYPGPGDNADIDRPTTCVAQTVPPQPAGTCILGGGSHPPVQRTDAGATAASGSSTIADNSIVVTDTGRSVTGTGIPLGRVRRPGRRHAGHAGGSRTSRAASPTPARSRSSTPPGIPLDTTAAVSGITLGRSTIRRGPALRRHRPDHGRRRHGQRAHQPLHQAGHA